ncbi:MAG: T9SS type A sorting domain-containing protein [Bacteroidales bacterium]|nr:T9SS type A sorting domain-containing protein [Bacteroidales bacterium]MCF8455198.1 T9SS type A sorting domain-containing protein [Bacteroidales bacterium]
MNTFTTSNQWKKIFSVTLCALCLVGFISLTSNAQVTFTQTVAADFNLGHLENVIVPGDYVSLPAKGTGFNNWLTATVLPQALSNHSMVTWKNTYLYCLGGNNGIADVSSVYKATLNSTGNSGWTVQNALPVALKDAAVVVGINTIYVFGGLLNGVPSNQIYYATLASNGTIGTWETSSVQLPMALWGHAAHYANGYIYIVGGSGSTSSSTAISNVYVATVDAYEVISQIQATTSLPQPRNGFSSAVYGNKLIVMGGFNNSGIKSNIVYYTSFNNNGTANAWQTATNLPVLVSNHSSTCFNGLLTIISGEKDVAGTPTLSNQMYYTDMANFPTLAWTLFTDPLYDFTKDGQAYSNNGLISYQGGLDLAAYPSYNARYSTVVSSTQFATTGTFISYPFYQLGDNRNILSLTSTLSPSSALTMYYRLAGNDGVWSDWVTATANPELINQFKQYVQYMFEYSGTGTATAQLSDVTLAIQGTQLSGNLNAMDTLKVVNSPYWATGNITFTAGTHYVEPGVTILFSPNTGLEIGQANMLFDGNALNPITLTYYTNEAGQWNGVYFNSNSDNGVSSDMNYVTIEKAGYGTNNANLRCNGTQEPYLYYCTLQEADGMGINLSTAAITVDNCLISGNTESGFTLVNSNPILISTTIDGNAGAGIQFEDNLSSPNFSACIIQNNLYGCYYPTPNMDIALLNGTVSIINNTYNGKAVPGGTINANRHWNDPELDIFILGNIKIGVSGSTCRLTIEPGNTLKFAEGTGLQVGFPQSGSNPFGGEIYAIGSVDSTILFTAMNGQPGGWNGIYFHDYSDIYGAISSMNYCIFENGNEYNVYFENTNSPTIYNSKFRNSLTDGCKFYNSVPLLDDCQFENNDRYPVYCTNYCKPNLIACSFTGNGNNYFTYVGGTLSSNLTLENYGIDYLFETAAKVGISGSFNTLTVDPGNTLRFPEGVGLQIAYHQSGFNPFGGGLYAVGTADSIITFTSLNGLSGGWEGIFFHGNSEAYNATSTLKYCTIEKGNAYNIYCESTNQPTLSFSTIQNSDSIGINCYNSMSSLSDLEIINNAGYGLYYNNAYYIPELSNLDISGNSLDGVVSEGGIISVNREWKFFGGNYNLLGSVTVCVHASTCQLTIDPGNSIRFFEGTGLQIGKSQSGYNPFGGELYAVGSADSMITFAPLNGQIGGWNGIYFHDHSNAYSSVSTMNYCLVEKGYTYNIYCENTDQPTLSNSTVQNSDSIGINCYNSTSVFNNLQIINNGSYGLYYNHPLYIPLHTNLSISGNSLNGLVSEGGTLDADRTWKYFGGDYNFLGSLTIAKHASFCELTVKPGITIKFAEGFGVQLGRSQSGYNPFGGAISAIGTMDSMITFTSLNGMAGGWTGFYFHNYSDAYSASSAFDYCIIEKALDANINCESTTTPLLENSIIRNSAKGINISNTSLTIRGSRIAYNSAYGIYVDGSSALTLGNTDSTGNDLYSNTLYNVYNNSASVIDARYNYWGDIDSVNIGLMNFDYYDDVAKGKIVLFPFIDFPFTHYQSVSHTGNLQYANGSLSIMGNDLVSLNSSTDTVSATTNGTGGFSMAQVNRDSYKYSFETAPETWGGVNSTDALFILKHFAHLDTLEGHLFTVGDANLSHTVNGTDAMLVMQRYAGLINSFPAGDYFYYLNDYTITNTAVYNDIRFLWMGDVNGSYSPGGSKSAPVLLHEGEIELVAGSEILVPLTIMQAADLSAVSLSINYPSQFLEFQEAVFANPNQSIITNSENGNIKIAWSNITPILLNMEDELVWLKFLVTSAPSGILLNLSIDANTELADENGEVLEIAMNTPELVANIITGIGSDDLPGFGMGEMYPNPIGIDGSLTYILPVNANVDLSVFNTIGQCVKILDSGSKQAGEHSVRFDCSDLNQGIYFYRLNISTESGNYFRVNKMVISR